MKFKDIIPWILVGALVFFSVFQSVRRFDCSTCITEVDTVVTYVFVKDTVFIDVETKVPVPYKVEVVRWRTQYDTIYEQLTDVKIDSLLDEYFMKKYYKDTIADEYMIAIISDVIKKNQIWDREFEYAFIKDKVLTVTQRVDTRRRVVFIGPYVGAINDKFGLGASILYQMKNDHMISLHGDALNKGLYFSTYWKLGLRK